MHLNSATSVPTWAAAQAIEKTTRQEDEGVRLWQPAVRVGGRQRCHPENHRRPVAVAHEDVSAPPEAADELADVSKGVFKGVGVKVTWLRA